MDFFNNKAKKPRLDLDTIYKTPQPPRAQAISHEVCNDENDNDSSKTTLQVASTGATTGELESNSGETPQSVGRSESNSGETSISAATDISSSKLDQPTQPKKKVWSPSNKGFPRSIWGPLS